MFGPHPSDSLPNLRTHVPPHAKVQACAARARCGSCGSLVPVARGRLRGRLGGRPGRALPRSASAPSAAAQRVCAQAPRPAAARAAALHLASQPARCRPRWSSRCARHSFGPCMPECFLRAIAVDDAIRLLPLGWGARLSVSRCSALTLLRKYVAARTTTSRPRGGSSIEKTGGVLLSQALAGQVPSALRGLTALFGMGRGVSPSPRPPEKGERPRLPRSLKTAQRHSGYHHHSVRSEERNPSSPRPISTGLLQTLPSFQIRPINLVVYQGSYSL
jgi:hypothetical protein